MVKVLYAGSFDPITRGHADIIERAGGMFDLVVGVGLNADKNCMFNVSDRVELIKTVFPDLNVVWYNGLTADYCKRNGIDYLVRGIRGAADFEYEKELERFNREHGVETIYLMAKPEYCNVSSTKVRSAIKNCRLDELERLVPKGIINKII